MINRRWLAATSLVAGALVIVSVAFALNNPTIGGTREGDYTCLAPYDAVLLGSTNDRGDPPDGASIYTRCTAADHDRFVLACGVLVAAVVVGVGGLVASRRRT